MHFRQFFLAAALVALAAAPAARAQVVFSENFDGLPLKLDAAPTFDWKLLTEGKVSLIGASPNPASEVGLPDPLPGHGAYVDLIGTSGIPAYLVSPNFSLSAGVEYVATFALAGNQASGVESVQVNFGDTELTYDVPATEGFVTRTMTFTPTSSALYSISFQTVGFNGVPAIGPGTSDRGALLDALAITAVPEPASYALLLAGLVGLHVVARRRIQP